MSPNEKGNNHVSCWASVGTILPGHLATWSAKTIGKRGIPEKSIQNVAQLRWNYLRRTLQSKVMAENRVLGNRPLYFTLQKSGTQFQRKESYLSKTSFVTFFCIDIWHTKSECYCQNSKICFLWTALMRIHAGTWPTLIWTIWILLNKLFENDVQLIFWPAHPRWECQLNGSRCTQKGSLLDPMTLPWSSWEKVWHWYQGGSPRWLRFWLLLLILVFRLALTINANSRTRKQLP